MLRHNTFFNIKKKKTAKEIIRKKNHSNLNHAPSIGVAFCELVVT
jgi:hypothetical protein